MLYRRLIFLWLSLLVTSGLGPLVFAATSINTATQHQELVSTAHANATVKLTAKHLTPGQQLSLVIEISYLDGVEIFFEPQQFDWQPFTLINHRKKSPQWQGSDSKNDSESNQWHITYIIDVIVPLAGEYQLAEMTLHSYLQQQHQSLVIQIPKILVTSSFSSAALAAKLQPIEKIPLLDNEEHSSHSLIMMMLALSLGFLVLMLAFRNQRIKAKQHDLFEQNLSAQSYPLPAELIVKANVNADCDWPALRQCMLQQLGFDPLEQQIDQQNIELSKRYISARFSTNNKAIFIELCQQCNLCQQIVLAKKEHHNA